MRRKSQTRAQSSGFESDEKKSDGLQGARQAVEELREDWAVMILILPSLVSALNTDVT